MTRIEPCRDCGVDTVGRVCPDCEEDARQAKVRNYGRITKHGRTNGYHQLQHRRERYG